MLTLSDTMAVLRGREKHLSGLMLILMLNLSGTNYALYLDLVEDKEVITMLCSKCSKDTNSLYDLMCQRCAKIKPLVVSKQKEEAIRKVCSKVIQRIRPDDKYDEWVSLTLSKIALIMKGEAKVVLAGSMAKGTNLR